MNGIKEKIYIYHGSNVEVPVPKILRDGFYKDFGYGFYCTRLEKQAKRWAMTKPGASVISKYLYCPDAGLKCKIFDEMTDEWLDFVVACRNGQEHGYDIVEGPMADDRIWNFIEGFLDGRISRSAFWELVKFDYPTHQILFSTEPALKSLTFEGSETL